MSGCPNCGREAPYAYCAHCGQDQGTLVPGVSAWIGELLNELLFVDRKLPRTLGLLIRSPGTLTQEWSAGKRGSYIRPLRLYLATALLLFLTWSVGGGTSNVISGAVEGVFATEAHNGSHDGSIDRSELAAAEADVMTWLPRVLLLVLVPLFALLVAGLFSGSNRRYGEHLVLALHIHAFGFLVLVVLSLGNLLQWGFWAQGGSAAVFILILLGYLYLSVRRVFGVTATTGAVKSAFLVVAYSAAFSVCLLGLVIVISAAVRGELGF